MIKLINPADVWKKETTDLPKLLINAIKLLREPE